METIYVIVIGALTACAAAGVLIAIKRPRYIAGTVAVVLLMAAACIIIPDLLRVYETDRKTLVILVAVLVVAGVCVFLWYGGEALSKLIAKKVPPPGPYSKLRRRRLTAEPEAAPEAPPVSAVELEDEPVEEAPPEKPAGAPERVTVRPVTEDEPEEQATSAPPQVTPVRLEPEPERDQPAERSEAEADSAERAAPQPPAVATIVVKTEPEEPVPEEEVSEPLSRPKAAAPQVTAVRLEREAEIETERVAVEAEPVEAAPVVAPPRIARVGKQLSEDELPEYGYEGKPAAKPRKRREK